MNTESDYYGSSKSAIPCTCGIIHLMMNAAARLPRDIWWSCI